MANCSKLIPVDKLMFAENVRSPECQRIDAMVELLRRNGYQAKYPLVVSDRGEEGYLVLCGNRRGLALCKLREEAPEDYKIIVGPTNGKVPAIVHSGLTPEEEILLRIDHGPGEDRVPLDEWSEFLAIRQLTQVGTLTQEAMAEKLGVVVLRGPNKGKANRPHVQTRVNLARLPSFVQEEMRKRTLDAKSTHLRWSDIAELYKVFDPESIDYPGGDGPLFRKAWAAAIAPKVAKGKVKDGATLTAPDAVKRSQAASSIGVGQVLLASTGQGSVSMPEVDAAILRGETAVILLARIADYLGEADYIALVSAAQQQVVVAAESESETVGTDIAKMEVVAT